MKGRPAGAAVCGRAPRRLLALLPLGLLLASSSLLSQTRTMAVAPTPNEFDLTVAAGERSTSNPLFLSDPTSPAQASPQTDYLSEMRMDLSMSRSSRRTRWSLRYSPFYTRYRENGWLSTSNHAFNYHGSYEVSRQSRIVLAEYFAYSRDPLHVATVEGGYDPVLTPETKRWRSLSDAGVETDLSRSLTLNAGVTGRVDRFQDPALADSETWAFRTGFEKKIGPDQGVSLIYRFARFVLGDEDAGPGGARVPDFTSHSLEGGWSRAVAGMSEIRLSGGVSQVIRQGDRQSLFTGSVAYRRPFRHADLSGTYRQSLSADTGVDTVAVSQNASVALSSRIGRITTVGLAADYGTRKSALAGGAQVDLTYEGVLVRGGVRLNDRLTLAGEASRRRQTDALVTGVYVNVTGYYLGLIYKIL